MVKVDKKISEREVLRFCLDWLTAKKIFHWRQNSGAFKTDKGNYIRFGQPGSADIICVYGGQIIALEIKGSSGKQSDTQKAWQKAFQKAGGLYVIISAPNQLEEFCASMLGI